MTPAEQGQGRLSGEERRLAAALLRDLAQSPRRSWLRGIEAQEIRTLALAAAGKLDCVGPMLPSERGEHAGLGPDADPDRYREETSFLPPIDRIQAEQGQGDWGSEVFKSDRVRELEQELEMCQRYFPFLQRSRADYKRRYEEAERKLAACQEELARVRQERKGLGELWDQAEAELEAAQVAPMRLIQERDALREALRAAKVYVDYCATEAKEPIKITAVQAQVDAALDQSGKGKYGLNDDALGDQVMP